MYNRLLCATSNYDHGRSQYVLYGGGHINQLGTGAKPIEATNNLSDN